MHYLSRVLLRRTDDMYFRKTHVLDGHDEEARDHAAAALHVESGLQIA